MNEAEIARVLREQYAWLETLQTISKKPILVKAIEGKAPEDATDKERRSYHWNYFKDVWSELKTPIYTRRILNNEILLDPDTKDWHVLKTEMDKVLSYLKSRNIPFLLSYSGGNGCHVSIYIKPFTLPDELLTRIRKYDADASLIIRETLVDMIFNESGADRKQLAIDSKKISFSKQRRGSMVREDGTLREDGNFKTIISEIPAEKPAVNSLPLVFPTPDMLKLWDIDGFGEILNRVEDALSKAAVNHEYNISDIDFNDTKLTEFPCIKILFEKGRRQGRFYGAQSIALMAKQCGYSWTLTEKEIEKFLKKCDGLSTADIRLRIDNVKPLFEDSEYHYHYHFSCREVKTNFGQGYCDYPNCPISKKVKVGAETKTEDGNNSNTPQHIETRAMEIMTNGDPIKFIINTHQTMHVGDIETAKSLLVSVGTQSIKNSKGLQPKLSGSWGMGKTHCCIVMVHIMPSECCVTTTLSDKAIYYDDSIRDGVVIFSDDVNPSEGLQEIIKRATSSFQTGCMYTTVVDQTARKYRIPARIIWWLTSVDDDVSMQMLSRIFGVEVDESPEQDNRVVSFLLKDAVKGKPELLENEDVEVCREIFRQIKQQQFFVDIPFAEHIIWNDKHNRRNLPVFLDIVRAFAVFRFKQRHIVDGNLVASIEDYDAAKELYCARAPNMRLKLNKAELDVCRTIHGLTKEQGECTAKDIERALNFSQGRVHQLIHGRKDRNESGLLHKVKGLFHEKRIEYDGDGDSKGSKTSTTKNYYLLNDFELLSAYDSIVGLPQTAIDDYYRYYPAITTDGNSDKSLSVDIRYNNKLYAITTITKKKKKEIVHTTNTYISDSHEEKKIFLSLKDGNCGNSGNSVSTDSENRGNSGGNSGVIVATDAGNSQNCFTCGTVLPDKNGHTNISESALGKKKYYCDSCFFKTRPELTIYDYSRNSRGVKT